MLSLFFVFSISLEIAAANPLNRSRFYLQQPIMVKAATTPTLDPDQGCTLTSNAEPNTYTMVCEKSDDYVLTEGTTESVSFQVSQIWRFYRWSFAFFSGENTLGYLTLGQNYTIRIWVSELSLDEQIQNELNGKVREPGEASQALTRVFYGLSEFPVVSLIGFDEEKLKKISKIG